MDSPAADEKLGAEASTVQPGATEDSPTSTTTTADSSPQGETVTASPAEDKPKSIAQALDGVKLEEPAGAAAEKDEQAGDDTDPDAETEKAETEAAGEQDEKPAETEKAADPDVPFHTRTEWKDLTTALKSLPDKGAKLMPVLRSVFQAETRAKERVAHLEPMARVTEELKSLTGDEQSFTAMQQVVRAYAQGDAAVEPILEQMLTHIRTVNGKVLTSPDLVQRKTALKGKLDAGLIDQGEFDEQTKLLTETEQARAGKKTAETKLQSTAKQTQAQEAERQQAATVQAINSWEENIRSRDPDFGNVTDVNDPNHGASVADQVFDAMCLKRMSAPNATTQDLIAAGQRAYTLAKGRNASAPQRERRVITATSSSVTAKPRPKTMREAMDAVKLD